MLLDISREVSTNIEGAKSFSVTENSAKLFAMLGTMLYKDKERSCLTELSSNALDAHAMNGNHDKPIQVTMPTILAQEISIRDFGPGMSEENVIKFLTTYGESSKQQNTNAIGGYGIGSKSPASVTDTWTIHSYHEGLHSQYLVFVSAEGVPALKKMFSKPTTETGVAVVIPVKADRIQAWNNAVQNTYEAYSVTPVIHNLGFNLRKRTWKLENDIFNICADGNINVYVDHRLYVVDRSKVREGSADQIVQMMCDLPDITLKFNSSEINKSLSREELQYDKKTLTSIQTRLVDAYAKMQEMWKVEVTDVAKNELQYFVTATQTLNKWFPNGYRSGIMATLYNRLSKGDKFFSDKFKYGTKNITFEFSTDVEPRFLGIHALGVRQYRSRSNDFFGYAFYHRNAKGELNLSIDGIEKVVFVEDDGATTMLNSRVKHAYSGKNNVLVMKSFDFLPDFLKGQVVKSATLVRPAIVRGATGSRVKTDYYKIDGRGFAKSTEGYFANEPRVAYIRFTKATTTSSILPEFTNFVDLMEKYDVSIVALKENTPVPTWAKHPEVILEEIFAEKQKNFEGIFKAMYLNEVKNDNRIGVLLRGKRKTANNSYWNDVVDMIENISKEKNPMLNLSDNQLEREAERTKELALVLKKNVPAIKKNSFDEVKKDLIALYPMLTFAINGYEYLTNQNNAAILMQYIESVGK